MGYWHRLQIWIAGMTQITHEIGADNTNGCSGYPKYTFLVAWREQLWCLEH